MLAGDASVLVLLVLLIVQGFGLRGCALICLCMQVCIAICSCFAYVAVLVLTSHLHQ